MQGTRSSIPGQGTRSHTPRLRGRTPQPRSKISHAVFMTRCSQINIKKKKKNTRLKFDAITSRVTFVPLSDHSSSLNLKLLFLKWWLYPDLHRLERTSRSEPGWLGCERQQWEQRVPGAWFNLTSSSPHPCHPERPWAQPRTHPAFLVARLWPGWVDSGQAVCSLESCVFWGQWVSQLDLHFSSKISVLHQGVVRGGAGYKGPQGRAPLKWAQRSSRADHLQPRNTHLGILS